MNAAPKPVTLKPSSTEAAHQNISALMTNRNRPSVSNVTGKVSSTSSGLTSVLNSPMTNAASIASPKLETVTPRYRCVTSSKAAASKSQRMISFMPSSIARPSREDDSVGEWHPLGAKPILRPPRRH